MILENVRGLSTRGELQGVFSKFEELRIYYEYLEEYLKQYSDKIHEKYKDEFKKYPNDPNLGGSINYEDWGWVELYPNIHRKSFIITCYSYFEKELFTLCKNLKESKQYSLDVTNSEGKGIEKVKNYLNEVRYFDISKHNKTKTWPEITNIRKIRNLIVHNDGILDRLDKDKAIRKYIAGRSDISIKGDEIIIDPDYCRHVVDTLEKFHTEICLKE
ncbi:MAG: hypothetical protein WC568_06635 [Candidatus Methanoperedens sp.]